MLHYKEGCISDDGSYFQLLMLKLIAKDLFSLKKEVYTNYHIGTTNCNALKLLCQMLLKMHAELKLEMFVILSGVNPLRIIFPTGYMRSFS